MRRLLAVLFVLVLLPVAAHADGEAKFAGVDGSLVHWRSWGKGEEAVVFIPGLTEDYTTWRHQIDAVKKNARVIALDLPGHGDSGAPKRDYTHDYFARAVLGVMDEAGVKKATLVGHSMGFPVSLAVLQKAPERVNGIVSVDGAVFLPFRNAADKAMREQMMTNVIAGLKGPLAQQTMTGFMQSMLPKAQPEVRTEVLGRVDKLPTYVTISVFENFTKSPVWEPRSYDVPMLAVYAQVSVAANPGLEEWLRARFPKGQIQVWRDVDHFIQLEQPARLSRAINGFVR